MRKPKIFENQNNSLLYRFLSSPGKDSDTVRHQALLAHRIISSSARVTFLICLVVTLCFYPHIPAETGVHFIGLKYMPEIHGFSENIHRILHEYQEIDVIAAKVWLFYPYAITGLVLLAGMLLPRLAGRLRTCPHRDSCTSFRQILPVTALKILEGRQPVGEFLPCHRQNYA